MKEAVILSTARTPIGRAYKGSLNNIKSPTMMGHVIHHALQRSGAEKQDIEDVIVGSALTMGTAGMNIARTSAIAAGLPVTAAGQTIDRQCASGLMAIATGAKQIMVDGMDFVVAGGQENISAVQGPFFEAAMAATDENVILQQAHAYMPMLQTAEYVAKKYNISREAQDEYALSSQMRTAQAQFEGKFDDELVSIDALQGVMNKETKAVSFQQVTLSKDEGNRPSTTIENLQSLSAVIEGGTVTAGNASQLSDGASACVLADSKVAEKRGLNPLGIYRGMMVVGNEPEEMGIGPIYAIPKLLKQHGIKISD
jgi:acetyl-CoA C-acetyltransferase/acetyl-CoA acyltransferase